MENFQKKHVYLKARREIPRLPWLPVVTEEPEPPSVHVTNAYDNMLFPLLLIKKSWTKAVPFKDTFEYMKPAESIGCSYNPAASRLNIQKLPPQKRERKEVPIPPTGMFGWPKEDWCKMVDETRCITEKKRKRTKVAGLVPITVSSISVKKN